MEVTSHESAFPRLTESEMRQVRDAGDRVELADGDFAFRTGDADIDFFVVESGKLSVVNPTDGGREIVAHEPGEFAGDIDLLTRRPVIVSARAVGPTALLRVRGPEFHKLLMTVPKLGEKLIVAFTVRREMLKNAGVLGLKVLGPAVDADATFAREFLQRNFVPFTFYDTDTDAGRAELAAVGRTEADAPVVVCGDGDVLVRPTAKQLADCAGLKHDCPDKVFDLAIVGAGPAGMTAAVYAASEALSTVVLDMVGPGGQAGGSSMIENFIGFPSGLSGAELSTRGVLQMMKFGAMLLTPVRATTLEPGPEFHTIRADDGTTVKARTVLVAAGARWRSLEFKSAGRFHRQGMYYAATSVEARTCTGKPVAVVGGGNSAGQAAMFLSECSQKVYMLIRGDSLAKGMSDYLVERIEANPKIEVRTGVEVTDAFGDECLEAIEVTSKEPSGTERLGCAAAFVFIGAEPHSGWLPDAVAKDDHGYVLVGPEALKSGKWALDREPVPLETTLPRVLAAGDVRCGSTKRVAFAV
ncbi:MAG TPA: FAD-dependent oxidoreductase, partial [Humisphaera sp.]